LADYSQTIAAELAAQPEMHLTRAYGKLSLERRVAPGGPLAGVT